MAERSMSKIYADFGTNDCESINAPILYWPYLTSLLAYATASGLVLLIILIQNSGGFSYSLDDPYIHLALSENLLRGHYGINPMEFSAPSSSIGYPFLLSGTLLLKLGQFGPLV